MLSMFLSAVLLLQIGFFGTVYADEPTDRVRTFLEDNSVGGTVGLYLKEVDGPVLAGYNEGFVFEPASSIKALIHFHAMRQVQDGAIINGDTVTLSTQVPWFTDQTAGGCPLQTGPASDTLQNGLVAMMNPSDNRWTQALRDFFGDANIDATRQAFSMADTALLSIIGCGGNQMTLVDAGNMYETVATGYLDPSTRATAYNLMINPTGRLDAIIDTEAIGLGLSSDGLNDFKNIRFAAEKAGSSSDGVLQYRIVAGWTLLPFKDETCNVVNREYVYGTFIHGADSVTDAPAAWTISGELFREQIRSALETWAECEADLEIASFDASISPAQVLIGESFQVDLTKIITNNGPASSSDVDVTVASNAPGLIVDPINAGGIVADLELGELAEVNESFEITCDEHGTKGATFTNNIAPINKVDPDLSNNEAEVSVNVECVIPVQIDIHPGSSVNPINVNSKQGVIPVAILNTDVGEFGLPIAIDATMIDPLSVHFGPRDQLINVNPPGGATEFHNKGHVQSDQDMLLHFKASESGLISSDTEACIIGQINIGGVMYTLFGCDAIAVKP
jgi:hypothetical protein